MSETFKEQNQSSPNDKSFDLFGKYDSFNDDMERLRKSITFDEYFTKAIENPGIVHTAHRTVYDALTHNPNFFEEGQFALYGSQKPIKEFLDVMRAAAEGHEVRKRMVLLLGPPGSGKSTLVNGTKRALEEYSRTDEGAIYAIDGCPMQEDPMHLIPSGMRRELEQEYEIKIEGSLCPHCQDKYGKLLDEGRSEALKSIKVNRVIFSEDERSGIGSFKPSDPKSQDITELVGSVDLSKLGEYGSASDAAAYRADGELQVANRGVMEFVEILKSDEKFLYVLLDLLQDRVIKAPRFPNVSADEVILAHTNNAEYKRYVSDDRNEALRDRMKVILVPYSLEASQERKIYDKLLSQSERVRRSDVHINPVALDVAANFSVLSRIKALPKYSKLDKLSIYDGEFGGNFTEGDLKEVAKLNVESGILDEGMTGVSPRFVIDALSMAMIRDGGDKQCLTAIDALRALRDNIDSHASTRDMSPQDKAALHEDLLLTKQLLDESARNEVRMAFIDHDAVESVFSNYLQNITAFCQKTKMQDSVSYEYADPDEKFMRSVEAQLEVSESGKKEFRQEVLIKIAAGVTSPRRSENEATVSLIDNHPRLREAIQSKLYADTKDTIDLAIGSNSTPNEKQRKRINGIMQSLKDDHGYCDHCAKQLIHYVGNLNRAS